MNTYKLRENEIVNGYSLQNALEKAGYRYTSIRHTKSKPDGTYVVHLCGCMNHELIFPKWLNKYKK